MFLERNYDNIAFFYDRLAGAVYGKSLIAAQQYLVKYIPANANVLIIGGGTGWILEEIANVHSSGLYITYIDASAKMIALAQKRDVGENRIKFIARPIQALEKGTVYDVILTPFFFDNFTNQNLKKIFSSVHSCTSPKGIWLYCDFQNTDIFWQKKILKIMYLFFKVSCGIEADRLPDADACFSEYGYRSKEQKLFMSGFVKSVVYERND